MEKSRGLEGCPCDLNLGVEQFLEKDVNDFQYITNHIIDFQGPSVTFERTMMKTKIEELKIRIGEYYFDKDNKLIAIPNQITLPKHPHIINPDETKKKIRERDNIFLDKNCEDKLHISIIKAAREMNIPAFIFEGFQSEDCIKAKLKSGKNVRKEKQCKCKLKDVCSCGRERYPELNIHENDIMELLDIRKLEDEEIEKCSQLLNVLKIRETDKKATDCGQTKAMKQKVEEVEGESWLFSKVIILKFLLFKKHDLVFYSNFICSVRKPN